MWVHQSVVTLPPAAQLGRQLATVIDDPAAVEWLQGRLSRYGSISMSSTSLEHYVWETLQDYARHDPAASVAPSIRLPALASAIIEGLSAAGPADS